MPAKRLRPPGFAMLVRPLVFGILLWSVGSPVWADLHDEFRVCRYKIFHQFKNVTAPTASTPLEQFCLGYAYWRGEKSIARLPRDPVRSAQWFTKAATQGHAGAQTVLGYHYEQGHGVPKNYGEALKWIRKAVDQDYPDGMFHLGRLYSTGKGVKASARDARKWFEKAAKGGSADAIVALRLERERVLTRPAHDKTDQARSAYDRKNYAVAAKLYREAADAGNAVAQVGIGVLLRNGDGVSQNEGEAVKWFRKAAAQGYARGQAQVGLRAVMGQGVSENWREAEQWCGKAADQYDALGLYCLGVMYQFGLGVPHDLETAIRYFDRAEDQGDGMSKFFAIHLRDPAHCVGVLSERERERYWGVCHYPKGIRFADSRERYKWLNGQMAKVAQEAEAFRRSMEGYGSGACGAAGGSWGGGGCRGEGGRTFDPGQQDRYGRPLW